MTRSGFVAAAILLSCGMALASPPTTPPASPRGPVILTVTGLDPATFPSGEVQFDVATLAELGEIHISTSSIWTQGVHDYTGVPLAELATTLHIAHQMILLHALNDYSVEMPVDDVDPKAPILAYAQDGVQMSVRDKGPIWVIFPYDESSRYRTDTMFSRSVWQLDRIDVER